MRDLIKPAICLFAICIVVTAALAFTDAATKDTIAARAALDAENARKEVLTSARQFEKIPDIEAMVAQDPDLVPVKEAYKGLNGTETAGYVFLLANKGYGGDIAITVGIDRQGKVAGVKIGEHKETPGLGTKASEKPFLSQLIDITPKEPLVVVKGGKAKPEQIDAISGATITSRAVVGAVQAAIDMAAQLSVKEGASN